MSKIEEYKKAQIAYVALKVEKQAMEKKFRELKQIVCNLQLAAIDELRNA